MLLRPKTPQHNVVVAVVVGTPPVGRTVSTLISALVFWLQGFFGSEDVGLLKALVLPLLPKSIITALTAWLRP